MTVTSNQIPGKDEGIHGSTWQLGIPETSTLVAATTQKPLPRLPDQPHAALRDAVIAENFDGEGGQLSDSAHGTDFVRLPHKKK